MTHKILGALLLTCSIGMNLSARTHANQTYFAARNELQQRGREWAQSAPHKGQVQSGGKFGATVDVSVFGSRTTNKDGMGKYFGAAIEDDNSDAVGTVKIVRDDNIAFDKTNALYGRLVDYVSAYGGTGTTNAPMNSVLTLKPYQTRVGAHVKLGWTADKVAECLKGIRFGVDLPVVRVSNMLGATEASEVASTADGKSTPLTFFQGNYAKTTPATDEQAAVTHGKLSTTALNQTGVADIRINAAYDMVVGDDCGLSFKGSFIVPTGNNSDAKFLWEPIVGNNNHFGAGVGFDAHSRLWENVEKRMSLWLSGSTEFTYLFRAREKRIAGLWDIANKRTAPWLQYSLAQKKSATNALTDGGLPLVNALAQDMYVTPGSHFESVLGLTLCWRKFHFNFGYNVFYKQSETVTLAEEWTSDTYELSNGTFDFNLGGDIAEPVQKPGKKTSGLSSFSSTKYYLDLAPCTSPDAETHTFLFGAGYDGQVKNITFSSSLGASYEIPSNNNKALQGWALFGKVGFTF